MKTPIKDFKFDYLGTLSLVVAIISFNVSFTIIVDGNWLLVGICIFVCIVACICFYYSEKYAKCGVCPLFVLKRPMIEILALNVFNGMSMYANNFVLP